MKCEKCMCLFWCAG